MVSGFAFASSALYRSQPEAGAHSFAEQINQTLLIDDSAVPNGGTRFCASRSTEACLKNVHLVLRPLPINGQDACATASKPFGAKPLHQLEDFLPHLK